ncbi:MAG: FtsX-like permease family protein [Spirochaetota bacterium]
MGLSWELACAILLRKKRHRFRDSPLFAAFIGITLSIIPLVLVLEVSDGMISGIMNRYIETFYSHVMLRFYNSPEEGLKEKVLALDRVHTAYNERSGAALLLAGQSRAAVQVRALEAPALESDEGLRKYLNVVSGALELTSGSILLAGDVALKLQVGVGDEVALLTGAKFGGMLRPKTRKFVVSGIVSTGYQELDRLWTFIAYRDAKEFFHSSTSQSLLHIKIDNAFDFEQLNQVMLQVQNLLGPNQARLQSWYSQVSEMQQSHQFSKSILVYIMYLIVAVGTVNIASSMVMLVLENSSEIAIMKTFGASKSLIRNTYIWVALLVGFIAIFYGTVFGAFISYFINEIIFVGNRLLDTIAGLFSLSERSWNLLDKSYYLEHIPVRIQVWPLVIMGAFVLLLTFLFSIIPALKAANMLPLSILRQNRS